MVLQPATMQNQLCNRATAAPTSTISLLPQASSKIQPQQHQQTPTGGFSQSIVQTGFISVPRGDETATLFHSPAAGGICGGGQFTTSVEDGSGSVSANSGSNSGFIEFVAANGIDGSRSILSTDDLSKWIQRGPNNTKVIGGRVHASQQIFHQHACVDSANSTIIQLPQTASRASITQQQQKQQVVFLTAPSGNGNATTANPHASFSNVVVQQTTALEQSRGVWTASSNTTGSAVTALTNPSQNQ
ncbi:unnamed protein product [Rodentolepis nana]|uniref:Uncharacterized protein n=1 Tax=Rodentolepis nana TaxID=102285 RepID=A0A0R3TYE3_RODNA|nr:unnamed protein product [Rodentolepis nana]